MSSSAASHSGLSTPVKCPSGSRALGRASASSDAAIISSRLRSASTSSAYLKFKHLALLGNAQLAVERIDGLRKDGAVRRSAAAADRAAAAVEEAQLHAALARHHVQSAMGAEDLPRAGQHAAVFVGVGIAEHDLLPVVPDWRAARDSRASSIARGRWPAHCEGLQSIRRAAPA